jgi:hypothetical protein
MGDDTHVSDVSWMVHQLTELLGREIHHVDSEKFEKFLGGVVLKDLFEASYASENFLFRVRELFLKGRRVTTA